MTFDYIYSLDSNLSIIISPDLVVGHKPDNIGWEVIYIFNVVTLCLIALVVDNFFSVIDFSLE